LTCAEIFKTTAIIAAAKARKDIAISHSILFYKATKADKANRTIKAIGRIWLSGQ
jgi:hypothetical protein